MNRSQLAELLAVNLTTVDNWVREGCPFVKRPVRQGVGNWEFSPAAVVQWRIDRERQSALGDLAKVDEAEARRRKMAAEAGLAELELQIKNGNAVSISDQEKEWVQMVGAARARLLAIPTKVGPSVAIEADPVACQSMIDAAINEALLELSNYGSERSESEDESDVSDVRERLTASVQALVKIRALAAGGGKSRLYSRIVEACDIGLDAGQKKREGVYHGGN